MPAVFKTAEGLSVSLKKAWFKGDTGNSVEIKKVFWKDHSGNMCDVMREGSLSFIADFSVPSSNTRYIGEVNGRLLVTPSDALGPNDGFSINQGTLVSTSFAVTHYRVYGRSFNDTHFILAGGRSNSSSDSFVKHGAAYNGELIKVSVSQFPYTFASSAGVSCKTKAIILGGYAASSGSYYERRDVFCFHAGSLVRTSFPALSNGAQYVRRAVDLEKFTITTAWKGSDSSNAQINGITQYTFEGVKTTIPSSPIPGPTMEGGHGIYPRFGGGLFYSKYAKPTGYYSQETVNEFYIISSDYVSTLYPRKSSVVSEPMFAAPTGYLHGEVTITPKAFEGDPVSSVCLLTADGIQSLENIDNGHEDIKSGLYCNEQFAYFNIDTRSNGHILQYKLEV